MSPRLPEVVAGPVRRFSATPAGARVARVVMPPLDRAVSRLTGGRTTMADLVALPTLVLTTTGRRTGEPRRQPLVYLRVGTGFVVVGTNWGQDHHPAWTHNLLADPAAVVELDGERVPVTARLTGGEEHDRLYARFEALAPNYRAYRERITGRPVRVFVLERV